MIVLAGDAREGLKGVATVLAYSMHDHQAPAPAGMHTPNSARGLHSRVRSSFSNSDEEVGDGSEGHIDGRLADALEAGSEFDEVRHRYVLSMQRKKQTISTSHRRKTLSINPT